MYLFLFTIIYCLVTNISIANLDPGPALGIYLIVLALIKGYLSEEIRDVFNFKKTKYLIEKIRFKDTVMELVSLVLIYINSYLMIDEPVSLFELVYLFVGFVIVYRFLFWGITRTIRERK